MSETHDLKVERRLTKLETKMNIIAYISGATFVSCLTLTIVFIINFTT